MIIEGEEIRVYRQAFQEDLSVHIRCTPIKTVGVKRIRSYVDTLEFVEHDPNSILTPCMMLMPSAAQALMDDLWTAGVRPTEGAGSAGAMAATQRHLDDLRKIVSSQIKVEL